MNILYYSAHAVLEDEEVRIFQGLGHKVCCLGINTKHGNSQNYRLRLHVDPVEIALYDLYERLGGVYSAPADSDDYIPEGFAQHFDVVIVMHQFHIIQQNWKKFRGTRVVWRTVGQEIEAFDRYLRPFREDGLLIVRYSPFEMRIENSLGCDAVIRFSKDAKVYSQWRGDVLKALTVVNSFTRRYTKEVAAYRGICERVDTVLGGAANFDFGTSAGFLEFEEQLELFRKHRAYIYINGSHLPYNLSFIEAWMTGIPMIVFAPYDLVGRFYEADVLVTHEKDGIICRSIDEVENACSRLFNDRNYAMAISVEGRKSARKFFDLEKITEEWRCFLTNFVSTEIA